MDEKIIIGTALAFARVASFLFMIPYLKGKYIPAVAKIAVSLAVAAAAASRMSNIAVNDAVQFMALLAGQTIIGLVLAFIVEMLMSAASAAGSIMDFDMGYSMSSIIDPNNGQRITPISSFLSVLFVTLFVAFGGISNLIYSISYSFNLSLNPLFLGDIRFVYALLGVFVYMMTAAVQIALPLMVSMFIVNIVVLILGKTAPQLNIFANMFALKIGVGLLFLIAAVPYTAHLFQGMNENLIEKFIEVMSLIMKK